jgi:hypothetical protein
MPTPDEEEVRKAKRKQAASSQQRSGRMSTILTDGTDDKLGA